MYRYHQVFARGGRMVTRKHVIAALKLSPLSEGMFRPHQAATPALRDAALAQLRETRKQSHPVLAGFRDAPSEVDRLFRGAENGKPTVEQTIGGVVHRLWRVQSAETQGALRPLFAPKKIHVLGDHARFEAMMAYADELDARSPLSMYSSGKYGMFALVNLDDPSLFVSPQHRVVRELSAKSADILARAKDTFIIEKIARDKLTEALGDSVAHQPAFAIAFKGEPDAYKLTLSPDVSVVGEGVSVHRALQKLDPVVSDLLFATKYLPGAKLTPERDLAAALAADGDAVIAMRALPLEGVLHADELRQLLPAESTTFAPELAELVTLTIDPDEDLA